MDEIRKHDGSRDGPRDGPRGGGATSKKVAGLVILVLILGFIYIHNIHVDAKREAELDTFMQKNNSGGIHIGNHSYIETLKTSRTKKTNAAILLGFIRGAIIGTVLGGDAGSIEGMLSFGTLNGVLYWVNEHLSEYI